MVAVGRGGELFFNWAEGDGAPAKAAETAAERRKLERDEDAQRRGSEEYKRTVRGVRAGRNAAVRAPRAIRVPTGMRRDETREKTENKGSLTSPASLTLDFTITSSSFS